MNDNRRGALLMMAAMAAFTLNDACLKALAGEVPLMQALFVRGALVSLALLVLLRRRGNLRFHPFAADGGRLALRTAAEIAAAWCYLTAVFNMPLANVAAIHQATPLTVTLAAALVLGEPVGWRRMTAIAVGFLGVLLIVRPGTSGFTVHSLYALGAVVAVVVRDLATRSISVRLPSMMVAFLTAIGVTVFAGFMSLLEPWAPMTMRHAVLLLLAAGLVLLAYVTSVAAMRVGEVASVAPFRYTSLVVAIIVGVLAFGDLPDGLTLLGAGVVVGAGIFTWWRERRAVGTAPAFGAATSLPEKRA